MKKGFEFPEISIYSFLAGDIITYSMPGDNTGLGGDEDFDVGGLNP